LLKEAAAMTTKVFAVWETLLDMHPCPLCRAQTGGHEIDVAAEDKSRTVCFACAAKNDPELAGSLGKLRRAQEGLRGHPREAEIVEGARELMRGLPNDYISRDQIDAAFMYICKAQ
jgi:hypothetical protein